MAIIDINSRLKHFKLVARITRVSAAGICAESSFDRAPVYGALESMAQLAALHVRHCLDFQRHAFLLKILTGGWPLQDHLKGLFRLSADLYSQSSNAFAYHVKAHGPGDGALHADLLIGTKPYDHEFQEHILKEHYREIFRKLQLGRGEVL